MTTHLLTADDVAGALQVSRAVVMRRAAAGEFDHVRIGRQVRFTPEQYDAIIASHVVAAKAEPDNPWGLRTRGRAS